MTTRQPSQTIDKSDPDWRLQLPADEVNGHALAAIDEEEEPETPADRIAVMLNSLSGDDKASVKLYRVIGPNKYGWCEEYSTAEFEAGGLTMIRDKWGPGEYQIRLYAPHPIRGNACIRAKDNITVVESKTAPVNAGTSPELAAMLKALAENQAAMLRALTEKPPAPDPMAQMTQMMGLMGVMRKAMGIDSNAPKSQISEIIAAVRELKGVSEELNPPKDPENADPLGAALPGLMEIIKAQMGQAPAAPQAPMAPVMLPPTIAVGPVAENPQPLTPEEDDAMGMIHAYMKILCGMAKAGDATVETAAEMVYAQLPDEMIEVIKSEQWWAQLAALAPQVAPHEAWFSKVRAAVLAMLAEDDADSNNQSLPER